jgi:hypothetical protein
MRWRAYTYGSIILWFVLSIVASAMMDKQDSPGLYMSWKVLYEFAHTFVFLTIGLGMILDYQDLLTWFGKHLNWRPPVFSFRMLGWFILLASLVVLATGIMDLLILLGIVPNWYELNSLGFARQGRIWYL